MPGNEFIGNEELDAIHSIFFTNNGWLYRYGRGHYVKDFEQKLAEYFGVCHAHAVSSGTAALKLSLQALGVKPGDEVITQAHTFIATVEAIVECGATPVIVDIDKSLNMCPDALRDAITRKTKVVIPVHMSGVPCHMKKIFKVIEECGTNIKILEDNAQSPGASFHGRLTGTFGDVGILSFDYGKMLTTGEGGTILTNDKSIYKKVSGLSDHGHANLPDVPRGLDECIGIGFNYKMTELQGALGCAQIHKLNKIIMAHRQCKASLKRKLGNILEFRKLPDSKGDVGVSLSFFLEDEKEAQQFVKKWNALGYSTYNLPDAYKWHFAGCWRHIKLVTKSLNVTRLLLNRTVAIPIKALYSEKDINEQVAAIKQIVEEIRYE